MEVGILTKDKRLQEQLLASEGAAKTEVVWRFFDDPEQAKKAAEDGAFRKLIVSDRFFDVGNMTEWLEDIRDCQPGTELAAMLSNRHDSRVNERFVKLCLANDCLYFRPGLTLNGLTEEICRFVSGLVDNVHADPVRNQLIALIGSTPNIGTTTVAFGLAVRLALDSTQTIGYLCLNLKSSKLHRYTGKDEPRFTLDGLRADLRANNLTSDKLLKVCETFRTVSRLHVLYGNQIREQADYYTPDEIEQVLEAARSAFNLCLIDVNAYWDNAATVCGMIRADRRIVVTTRELAHFQEDIRRWIKPAATLYGMAPSAFDLIVNQSGGESGRGGVRLKDIRRETSMQPFGEISRHAGLHEYADEGRLLELLGGNHPINAELSRISDKLIALYGLPRATSAMQPNLRQHRRHWFRMASST
jgi:MinD-like ATPase involved in chromosome partitioning or flagellar assembly